MVTNYLQYNDPLKIIWRKGTVDDPYVDKTDSLKIINNRVVLSEIPDEFHHVTITGYTEIYKGVPLANEFIVNYQNGIVTFNPTEEGKSVTAAYKGRGIVLYPAERIYLHNENPDVVETLQEIIDSGQEAIYAVGGLQGKIDEASALEDSLEVDIATGNTLHNDLQQDIAGGNALYINLQNDITTGDILHADLQNGIATADTSRTNLDNSITTANSIKTNLDNSITTGNTLQTELNTTITTGNTLHADLQGDLAAGNTLKTNLAAEITEAANINTILGGTIVDGQNKIEEMTGINTQISVWESYDDLKTYYPLNKVTYNGSSYICLQECTGITPADTAYWLMIAQKGADGSGTGDMHTSTYDSDLDGKVNSADTADRVEWAGVLNVPSVETQLGYTPVNKAGDTMSGILDAADLAVDGNPVWHAGNFDPANKADLSVVNAHLADFEQHVTQIEKDTWNEKQDALGYTPVPNTRKINGKALSTDISLIPSDVGAEPTFSKNTAFNKNFGTVAGTVCQGNDSRLSNSRRCNNTFDNASTARTNLGLTGTSNTTHYHDGRYVQTRVYNGILQYYDGGWKDVMTSPIKSIQRGMSGVVSYPTNYQDITISSVDLNKSFVVCSTSNGADLDHSYDATARLTSSTNLQLQRISGGTTTSYVAWEVIEFI